MKIKKQHQAYLHGINAIFDAQKETPEFKELDLLALVLERCEKDLGKTLNSRASASELFSGARKLNLNYIRVINKSLKAPTEIFIRDYELQT